MRRALALTLLLGLVVALGAAAAPTRTVKPAGAALAFDLPRGWHQTAPDKGWTFEAVGPRFSGWVFLSVVHAVVANRSFQRSLVAFERSQAKRLGPHVKLQVTATTVDGEPATRIFAAGADTNAQVVYGFQHAGREYMLVYATTTTQLPSQREIFAASAASVRFLPEGP
jgi:hypothetical protein